jgi:hypothetical protein
MSIDPSINVVVFEVRRGLKICLLLLLDHGTLTLEARRPEQ